MRVLQDSIVIACPPDKVFAFVNDFGAYPRWQKGVIGAEKVSDGPLGNGSWIEETRRFIGQEIKLRWQVTEFEPNRKRGFRVTNGPLLSEGAMTFEPVSGGATRFSIRVEMQGRGLFRWLEVLLVQALTRQNRATNERLKRLLESPEVTRV